VDVFDAGTDGEGLRIGVVQARFNEPVCTALREACLERLTRLGVSDEDIFVCSVPGALEIPLALQKLAQTGEFDALVALGAVIRGDTYHFEVVSNDACRAIMEVQLDTGIPIANGVLTCDTDEQAEVRTQPKGADCAQAAVEMANLQKAMLQ